ncbi:hypothetical protein L593_12255 [Salinarchaeum sp. Harcht-Bsk1]|uniref:vWA domain-containing protein n=1 Tax=Salinarchaeum sp. Harcht-Bsk1 TaxID=1333523 RepID=UPI0003422BA0|nr:VWA domain-containing protein [Salinarchaeum sp. Harcht-Bsk1]AGN02392.1 hypothetical protein L593_12255 [Salinarchaeum sp. Harcht-Bsk1]
MDTTHADIESGERHDIEVELVSRRSIETEHGTVNRLLVTDRTATQFSVLVAEDSEPLLDLKTGATHRIAGLLGADPLPALPESEQDCPDCGAVLRPGRPFDAVGPAVTRAASELGLEEAFGVVDANAIVRRVRANEDRIDDWQPMHTEERLDPPVYVCRGCHRQLTRADVRQAPGLESHPDDGQFGDSNHCEANHSHAAPETVGLATGGAKDVTNFRENIANGYTPKPGAITDEGLFYDYHFETGERSSTDALFAPRYAAARSDHPITGETETFLSVGLDSTLSVDEFERPRLDLIAVLDVSGSMNSPFDEYYYDQQGRQRETQADDVTKLDAATQSLCALTTQLRPSDRLGIVLFNQQAHVAKPLRDVDSTDMPAIRRHIRNVSAGGGTNLADGFEAARSMFGSRNGPNVEQRVVFMTDMMPNTGTTDEKTLQRRFADAAVEGIHTTFVGMGLDENADLVKTLSGIRGANHYFVHSAAEFERRLGEEFDYMVTPLVYDLSLELDGDGCEVAAVHRSPSAEATTGQLIDVGTLFPSAKTDGEARGGIVLVRLDQMDPDADVELVATWSERDGGTHTERRSVELPSDSVSFGHDGVRKAVALTRYASALRSWARDVHEGEPPEAGVDDWQLEKFLGRHEEMSVPLVVPGEHADRFQQLREYLEQEMVAVGDEDLQREIDLLETLATHPVRINGEVTEG